MYCRILTIRHSEKDLAMKTIKRSLLARGGEEASQRGISIAQRIFKTVKILYDIMIMDICPYTLFKPIDCTEL